MLAKIKSFIKKYLTIVAGISLAFIFLMVEYAIHYFMVPDASIRQHWFNVDPMEFHMRLLVIIMMLAFGIFAHILIARKKTAEMEANKNQILYQGLFSSMLNGFALHRIIVDESGRPIDYEFLEANDAFERMTGLARKDIIGRRMSVVMPELKNDPFDWVGTYGRVALNNEKLQIEQYSTALGKWYNISAYSPSAGEFATVIEDISERKKIDRLVMESQERMEVIFSSIQAGIVVVDRETHNITYVNQAASEMIGAPQNDIMDRPCHKFICPAEVGACPITDKGQKIDNSERILLTVDGRQIPIIKTVIEAELIGRKVLVESFVDISERKLAEQALKEKRDTLLAITDSAQDAIIMIDSEGKISFWNPAAESILGYPANEALGKNLHQLITPEKYLAGHAKAFPEFQRTGKGSAVGKNIELQAIRKDGTEIEVELSLSAVKIDDNWNAVGLIRDITERKQIEENLKKSEAQKKLILQSMPVAVYTSKIDQETDATWISGNVFDLTGFSVEEFLSESDFWRKRLHPADRDKVLAVFKNGALSGLGEVEYQWRHKDGSYKWFQDRFIVNQDGEQSEFLGVMSDITERKLNEKEIEKIHRQIKLLLDSVGEGIYGLDNLGKTIFINPAGAQLLGYQPEEMLGKVQHELIHHTKPDGSSYKINDCPIQASFKDGNVHHVTGEIFWRKDGSSFPVEYISSPIAEEGKNNGSVVVFRDVAERKQAETMQAAIYKISEISSSADNLLELYSGLHMIIDELMSTANFYIAMYNEKDDMLEFPYFVDERDPSPGSRKLKNGLTEYVIKNRKSLLAPPMVQKKLAKNGDVVIVGTPSIDWMGVPLNIGKTILGALVVQSYRQEVRFGAKELAILNFISDNIAAAILRKKSEDERKKLITELQASLDNIKTLKGLVPICSNCKKIRNDSGYWQQVEEYVSEHTEADFSHGICDECAHKLYPQYFKDKKNKTKGDEVG